MKRIDVKTIEDLVILMDEEAVRWKRQDSENAMANGAGIMQQWNNRSERAYKELPMCIHALITVDQIIEHADGSKRMTFQMFAFYFDDDGKLVDKPAEQLEKLAAEQDNG